MENIYLQMYSLAEYGREHTFEENLKVIAEMGYAGVEPFAGTNYGELSPEQVKAMLEKYGLGMRSCHLGMGQMEAFFPLLQAVGARYAICASHPFSNMEEIEDCAAQLNALGQKAKQYGLKVGYHNHTQEFNKIGEKFFLELLMEKTDPETVVFQLDCGWATAAGIDCVEFLKQYKDRFVAIHIKENSKVIGAEKPRSPKDPKPAVQRDENGRPIMTPEMIKRMQERQSWNVATGSGLVDWKKVKAICDEIGIDLFVVEREASYEGKDRLECLKADVEFLKANV